MARFFGQVGYVTQVETVPGVWQNLEKVRKMKGDIIRQNSNNRGSSQLHDDVVLNHRISLIGDAYCFDNYFNLKWVKMDTKKWKVVGVEIQRPRIIVSLGGLWNEG